MAFKGGSYDMTGSAPTDKSDADRTAYLQWFKPENAITEVNRSHSARNDERAGSGRQVGKEESGTDGDDISRGQWDNKAEFVLSCIGMSVGLGNVWRFPYLAYDNGGGAFFIAYLVLQLLIGKPMYLMELTMAQYSNYGPTKVWALNPAAKGIGISMCIISLLTGIYYNVVMAYTLYFFFSSMQKTLPWTECKPEWENCISERLGPAPDPCTDNIMQFAIMKTPACQCVNNDTIDSLHAFNCTPVYKTSTELYFYKEVIQLSDGLDSENLGTPLWKLALCLLLSWIIVVLCLIKGIKSSGKVVYFTATFPYVILLILLVRGAMLEGAVDGVEFFIVPKWDKLLDVKVWVAAAGQMFFSLSVSFGGIIMFGSYNKFRNNVYIDALFISVMDLVTSVIAGFVVFTTFGGMAHTIGTTVDKVAKSGYGLAFVAYPEALSKLPPSQLWSILFFFMLFTLGLDSEFGIMETVLTCLQDEWPQLRKKKSIMCIGFGVACYLLALPCVCPGGDYVVTLMDHYGADFTVIIIASMEVISVMWVYGVMRFLGDMEYMLGKKPAGWPYWVFCWAFTSPVLITVLFLYRMIEYVPPKYNETTFFPQFAQNIGWAVMCVGLCPVPIWFLYHAYRTFSNHPNLTFTQKVKKMFEPTPEWRPSDGSTRDQPSIPMEKTGFDNLAMSQSQDSSLNKY